MVSRENANVQGWVRGKAQNDTGGQDVTDKEYEMLSELDSVKNSKRVSEYSRRGC